MFDQFYTTLESLGIVPVVVLDKVEDAAPLAHALMAAGMKSAEVTFRTAWPRPSPRCALAPALS